MIIECLYDTCEPARVCVCVRAWAADCWPLDTDVRNFRLSLFFLSVFLIFSAFEID